MAVAVACGILIARYLGAQDFGKYAFVVALVSFFGCFVDMGLDNIIIRETAKGREGDFFGAALLIRSAASVFTLALLGVAVEILDLSPEITKAAWLAFVTLVVAKQVGLGIFRAMAIGKERAHFDTFLTVPFQLARLGAVLWVIQTGRSFVDFFVTFLVVDTLHAIVAL
ncbi:MAG: oligosaccharide flippase family protein [Candidatus Lindowbacteria bacterium]|nr:oligosaccharide flippase family protein [Candidatus Lindowbacteria bacterium]